MVARVEPSDEFVRAARAARRRAMFAVRMVPAGLWVATICLGLLSRAALSGAPAKYLGVGLWTSSVYFLLFVIRPRFRPWTALALTLLISWGVELAQLSDVPRRLSAIHPLVRLVFGEVFNPADLVALAAGAIAAWLVGLLILPSLWLGEVHKRSSLSRPE